MKLVLFLLVAVTVIVVVGKLLGSTLIKPESPENLKKVRDLCFTYLEADYRCSQDGYESFQRTDINRTLSKIAYYCGRLEGYKYCRPCSAKDPVECRYAPKECVFECCQLYCPPATRNST